MDNEIPEFEHEKAKKHKSKTRSVSYLKLF